MDIKYYHTIFYVGSLFSHTILVQPILNSLLILVTLLTNISVLRLLLCGAHFHHSVFPILLFSSNRITELATTGGLFCCFVLQTITLEKHTLRKPHAPESYHSFLSYSITLSYRPSISDCNATKRLSKSLWWASNGSKPKIRQYIRHGSRRLVAIGVITLLIWLLGYIPFICFH